MDHWNSVKHPWFNYSAGNGFYHSDKVWIEHPEIPLGFVSGYVQRIKAGEDVARPIERIRAERDRIVEEYTALLSSDEDREAFQGKLGLARVVFPYVENHNFYVEHWSHSVMFRKMKELGDVFVKEGFLGSREDIFYLKRDEVNEALWTCTRHGPSAPAPAARCTGRGRWIVAGESSTPLGSGPRRPPSANHRRW